MENIHDVFGALTYLVSFIEKIKLVIPHCLYSVTNIAQLTNLDIDLHMPSHSNFNYFTTHDFHVNKDISTCLSSNAFSFLNCNRRSFQANIENLTNMLSELYFPLSVIGLTETKLKIDQEEILNIIIPGYSF